MSGTPTTEEVRRKYAEWWIEGEYFGDDDPDALAEFDRWLQAIKDEAFARGWGAGSNDEFS